MTRIEQPQQPHRQRPGFAAGSEGWDGSEDASRPVASSGERIARDEPAARRESDAGTQSDYALSQSAQADDDDGRFDVSEELNFDVQSDAARRVGQGPFEGGAPMDEAGQTDAEDSALKDAVERSVPPSE